ncbi:condensation domain-containing protein, partial [Frankia sp. R82]|uniref:condensation domain-containing protein n=1 Tax=Frankia sp. R82 TaxID=2950553 RepID=UPI002043B6E7
DGAAAALGVARRRPEPAGAASVIYTSGSTGRPKAVVGTHRGLANLFGSHAVDLVAPALRAAGPERDALRVLHAASFSFDGSWEPLLWLLAGHEVHVVDERTARDAAALVAHLERIRVDVLDLTPTYLQELMKNGFLRPDGHRPGVLLVGGEATPPPLWEQLRAIPGMAVHDLYGPTEYSVDAYGWHSTGDAAGTAGAGAAGTAWAAPIANTHAYLLDPALEPVADGVPGELYLAGPGLARGYLGRPELSAGRFVADPFGAAGERMYRTGDLARRRPDGSLAFLGRGDDQIKLRGLRIELGEIERALEAAPDVRQAAVCHRPDAPPALQLVGYVVPAEVVAAEVVPAETATAVATALGETARDHVSRVLPGYMVPQAVVVLDRLPRTTNGKLDRAALPEPVATASTAGRRPRDAREGLLAERFAAVLGVDRVGVDDDFFTLGGHSLLVMRLCAAIRATFGVEITPRAVFEAPTVARLARRMDTAGAARPAVGRRIRPQQLPLSHAQQRMWVLGQLEGPSPTYNIPLTWRLTGPLDLAVLRTAVDDVVARHEALRTVFPALAPEGEPVQRILDPAQVHVPFEVIDRTAPAQPGPQDSELADLLVAAAAHPFDLEREVPIRVTVVRRTPTLHLAQLLIHHIAADEGSDLPLSRDLSTAYRARAAGGAPDWAPLPVQYADYALWQRDLLGDESDPTSPAAVSRRFWRATLAGLPVELALPTDRPRPDEPTHAGGIVTASIDADLVTALRALGREHDASLFMVVRSAVATLLHRLGAGVDVPIGTPVSGRVDAALDDLVGFFLNTLVLRTDLSGDPSFADLLGRVRAADLAALDHQDLPFDRVVDAVNPPRLLARHPLFQVMIVYLAASDVADGLDLAAAIGQPEPVRRATAKFDLSFDVVERHPDAGGGLTIGVAYSDDLFDRATAERLAACLRHLLAALADAPTAPIGALEVTDDAGHPVVFPTRQLAAPMLERPIDTAGTAAAETEARIGAEAGVGVEGPPSRRAAANEIESVLVTTFASVLGVDEVGVDDDFFALGGDSIVAMRLVTRIRAAGFTVTPRQLFGHRTPATLATVTRRRAVRPARPAPPAAERAAHPDTFAAGTSANGTSAGTGSAGAGTGGEQVLPPTPALQSARGRDERTGSRPAFASFTSPVLLRTPARLDLDTLVAGLATVIDRHEVLRARLVRVAGAGADGGPAWSLAIAAPGSVDVPSLVRRVDATEFAATVGHDAGHDAGFGSRSGLAMLAGLAATTNAEIDPDRGRMLRAVWLDAGTAAPGRLLLIIHHALIDGVSWPVVLEDLATAVTALRAGASPDLAPVAVAFGDWARRLDARAHDPRTEERLPFWQDLLAGATPVTWSSAVPAAPDPPPAGSAGWSGSSGSSGSAGPSEGAVAVSVPPARATALLSTVPAALGIGVDELLLAALSLAVAEQTRPDATGRSGLVVAMQAHGRQEHLVDDADLTRTVGWLAEIHPFLLERSGADDGDENLDGTVARVRALMAQIPDGGTDYSMLRYLNPRTAPQLATAAAPTIYLNYVGRLTRGQVTDWSVAAEDEALFADWNADQPDPFPLSLIVRVLDGPDGPELTARWTTGDGAPPAAVVSALAAAWQRALDALADRAGRLGTAPPAP